MSVSSFSTGLFRVSFVPSTIFPPISFPLLITFSPPALIPPMIPTFSCVAFPSSSIFTAVPALSIFSLIVSPTSFPFSLSVVQVSFTFSTAVSPTSWTVLPTVFAIVEAPWRGFFTSSFPH